MLNDLEQTVIRTGWELFVLALMPKHVHLFCRTPQPNFSKAMQYVLTGYLHLNPTRTNGAGSQGWQKDWGQKNQQAIQVPMMLPWAIFLSPNLPVEFIAGR